MSRMYASQDLAFDRMEAYSGGKIVTDSTEEKPPTFTAPDLAMACETKKQITSNPPKKCTHCGGKLDRVVEFRNDIMAYCGTKGRYKSEILFKAPSSLEVPIYQQFCVFQGPDSPIVVPSPGGARGGPTPSRRHPSQIPTQQAFVQSPWPQAQDYVEIADFSPSVDSMASPMSEMPAHIPMSEIPAYIPMSAMPAPHIPMSEMPAHHIPMSESFIPPSEMYIPPSNIPMSEMLAPSLEYEQQIQEDWTPPTLHSRDTQCVKCGQALRDHNQSVDKNGWAKTGTKTEAYPPDWPVWNEKAKTWSSKKK